ncbi:hypothetical protein L3X38_045282 [Prunus dulcis]|uniref:CHY-type/CTCHY-type/RING-type Zinc finger protein n=1 Tax=Prunus dulcis TaxID=3755 RepID=A0AAD4V1Q0_PRUDU|nr:hypothetical protein L3X38_045282 [Prunus dulcis]
MQLSCLCYLKLRVILLHFFISGDYSCCVKPYTKTSIVDKANPRCDHYRRRCKIRAPCCDQIFPCRHCHNEAASSLSNPKDRHELVRQDVKQVVCSVCNTEQQVAQLCSNCGVNMGEYYCDICKFYDDDISKQQFHCNECGICSRWSVTTSFIVRSVALAM